MSQSKEMLGVREVPALEDFCGDLYHPLDPSKREIRLLEIHGPLDAQGRIQYPLSIVSLDDKPSYIALSYQWKPDIYFGENVIVVAINGLELHLSENLSSFLLHLPHLKLPNSHGHQHLEVKNEVQFWIDAICINQQDLQERAQQVGVMRQIYTYASIV